MEKSPENIHMATLVRLNVAVAALQAASTEYRALTLDADISDGERERHFAVQRLIGDALAIAFGTKTDVPPELRERSTMQIMHDPAALTRFLSIDCR